MISFVQGELVSEIPSVNRGANYGDGLFETMRYESDTIPLWDYHLARLMHGAEVLGIDQEGAQVQSELGLLLSHLKQKGLSEGIIKFRLVRGGNNRGYAPEAAADHWRIFELFSGLPLWGQAQTAILCSHRLPMHPALAGIKHLNRLDQVLAAGEVTPGADTGIMLDTQGLVRCGIDSNIFIESGGRVYTPKVTEAGVAGVFRSYLLDQIFPQLDIEVVEGELAVDDLLKAEGLWLSNAIRGLRPVSQIIDMKSYSSTYSPLLLAAASLARTNLGIRGRGAGEF